MGDAALEVAARDAVDAAVELERFARRKIPPELVLLAEQQGELLAVGDGPLPRREAQHRGRAAGGMEQAGEHLERGGLAGAVGPEEADELPFLDRKADVFHGGSLLVFATQQAAQRTEQPRLFLVSTEDSRESLHLDDGSGGHGVGQKRNEAPRKRLTSGAVGVTPTSTPASSWIFFVGRYVKPKSTDPIQRLPLSKPTQLVNST